MRPRKRWMDGALSPQGSKAQLSHPTALLKHWYLSATILLRGAAGRGSSSTLRYLAPSGSQHGTAEAPASAQCQVSAASTRSILVLPWLARPARSHFTPSLAQDLNWVELNTCPYVFGEQQAGQVTARTGRSGLEFFDVANSPELQLRGTETSGKFELTM